MRFIAALGGGDFNRRKSEAGLLGWERRFQGLPAWSHPEASLKSGMKRLVELRGHASPFTVISDRSRNSTDGREMIRLFPICLALFSLGCSGTECANEPIAEMVSPDGSKKVVLFSRNCGATTGFSTQGAILNRGDALPNESGSAFIIDSGSVKVFWAGDSKIVVTLEGSARAFKSEPSDRGVAIEYQSK